MQFAIYCLDKPDSLDLRMATRNAHLAYMDTKPIDIVLAGPLLDDAGGMRGSLFIVEADDLAAVRRFSEADPYRKAGLFESVTFHGFRKVLPQVKVIYNYAAGPEFAESLAALSRVRHSTWRCAPSPKTRACSNCCATAEVLWHCLRPVDAASSTRRRDLRLVQKIGVGVNTIDLERARARGIAVCNMPGTNSRAVAEHTLGSDARGVAADPAIRRRHAPRRRLVVARSAPGSARRNRRTHDRPRRHGRHSATARADADRDGRRRDLHRATAKPALPYAFVDARRTARTRRHRQPARAAVGRQRGTC